MTGREDVAVGDGEGEVSQTEMVTDYLFCDGRHRRLALRGSPATARGCGELAIGSPRRDRCRVRAQFRVRENFVNHLRGRPPPEVPVGHLGCAGD